MATAVAGQPQASSTQPNASITWTYAISAGFSGTWTAALFQSPSLAGTYTQIPSTVITGTTENTGTLTAPAYTTPTTSYYYQVQISGGNLSLNPTIGTSLYFYSPFQGPQGVQGSQGVQGIQGPIGPVGPQGQQGVQGIVNIVPNTSNAVLLATNNVGTITTTNNLTFSGTPGILSIIGQVNANSTLVHTLGAVTLTNGAIAGVTTLNTVTISSGGNVSGMGTLGCGAITSSGALALGANTVTCGAITSSGALALGANTVTCGAITSSGTLSLGANIISAGTTNTINSLSINAGTCTGVDFIATSDQRTKTDISTISDALEIVKGMRGVYFTRIGQSNRTVGVIAQEVETVLPEVVHTGDDDMKSVSYGNIVGVLIEAVKTLSERLEKIEGMK